MPKPPCESSQLKLQRAQEHAQAIWDEVRQWNKSDFHEIFRQKNADATRHSLIFRMLKKPDLIRWSLLAGDCIHNLRSALDHCIYDIAVYETGLNPPPGEGILQFPIYDSLTDFNSKLWRLKSLSDVVRTELETVQPYNRPDSKVPPLLSLVNLFDNTDKHRFLRVTVDRITAVEFTNIRNFGDAQLIETHYPLGSLSSLENRTEIAALVFDRSAFNVEYGYVLNISVTIDHPPGPSKMPFSPLVAILLGLIDETRSVIDILETVVP